MTPARTMSLGTFLAARSRVSNGDPHVIFAGGSRYVRPSIRAQIDREAFEELSGLGLTRGRRLGDWFESALQIQDHPDLQFHAHARSRDKHYGVLISVLERDGVIALCEENRVTLKPIPRERSHAGLLIKQLPDFRPAKFTPFSLPQHEIDGRSEEAARLNDILRRRHGGHGELHAARRSRNHIMVRAPVPLTYLDTSTGRVGFAVTGPPDNRYVTVFPGDQLADKLADLR